jgi:deazaflavin-dependent oxidoreductase (nitroreductase family)
MAYADKMIKVNSQKFIHLTTKGRKTGQPHRVELWFAVSDGKVFLSHEGKETDWMKNIKQNGEVSFEIGGEHFTGIGHYIEGSDEAWRCKVALYEKYYGKATKEIIDDWFSLSTLITIETS